MKRFQHKVCEKVDRDANATPTPDRCSDPWQYDAVKADNAQSLIMACISEVKMRGLETPFLFRPFRPGSTCHSTMNFIRRHFRNALAPSKDDFAADLRLLDPHEIMSILRWILSRLEGGLCSIARYRLFDSYEEQLERAPKCYQPLVDVLFDCDIKRNVFYALLDFLTMIAANAAQNGHTAITLAKECSFFIFSSDSMEHNQFKEAYSAWENIALATQHLFFGYMRTMLARSASGICMIPASLHSLIMQESYPPKRHVAQSMKKILKLRINVAKISSSPLTLLQRALSHASKIDSAVLQSMSDSPENYGMSDECYRVVKSIEAVNSRRIERMASDVSDAEWLEFHDYGFDILSNGASARKRATTGTMNDGKSRARPKTPNWAEFMYTGFAQYGCPHVVPILPMHLHLPSIDQGTLNTLSSAPHDMGTLTEVNSIRVDSAFSTAWLMSLAGEASDKLKGYFGRCLVVEAARLVGLVVIEEVLQPEADHLHEHHKDNCKPFTLFRTRHKKSTNVVASHDRFVSVSPEDNLDHIRARLQIIFLKAQASCMDGPRAAKPVAVAGRVDSGFSTSELKADVSVAVAWSVAYDRELSEPRQTSPPCGNVMAKSTLSEEVQSQTAHIGEVKSILEDSADLTRPMHHQAFPRMVNETLQKLPIQITRKMSLKNRVLERFKSLRRRQPIVVEEGLFWDSWHQDGSSRDEIDSGFAHAMPEDENAQSSADLTTGKASRPRLNSSNMTEPDDEDISIHSASVSSIASSNVSTVLLPDYHIKREERMNSANTDAPNGNTPKRPILQDQEPQSLPLNVSRDEHQFRRRHAQAGLSRSGPRDASLVYPRPFTRTRSDKRMSVTLPRSLDYSRGRRRDFFDPELHDTTYATRDGETTEERLTRIQDKVARLMT